MSCRPPLELRQLPSFKYEGRSHTMHCIRGDAMATNPNTNHSRQFHGCGTSAGHHQSQQDLGHGHVPPLDTGQGPTKPVLSALGPRQTQQSRLFYQTACTHSPSSHALCVSTSTIASSQPSSTVSCQLELWVCIESQVPVPGKSPRYNQYSTGKLQPKSVTVA